jgi:peptidyl-dipeptidase Dcp
VLPEPLVAKLIAQRKFNQGFATVEYAASARVDLDLHETELTAPLDVNAFEARVRQEIGMPSAVALRHRPAHFLHVFAGEGYAAGYYTYLWAEVMEADVFRAFEEKGDIFDAETALRLRESIYASGGSMLPADAFRAFRGRAPSTGALMEKRGLR